MGQCHDVTTRSSQRDTLSRFIALSLPLLLFGLLAASASRLSASTNHDISVCPAGPPACDFADIQSALDAAAAGDRVIVAPGVYTGQLRLKSGVAISSTAGPRFTTMYALASPMIAGSDVVSATLRGVTISGQGLLTGALGIELHNSEVSLADMVISDLKGPNGAPGAPNGSTAVALRADGTSRLTLDGVTIQRLHGGAGLALSGAVGGDAIGILAIDAAQVTASRTTIAGLQGGAAGNTPYPFTCLGQGGNAHAIRASGNVALTVSDSLVSGLIGGDPCQGLLENCSFGAGEVAGISASGGRVLVRGVRFEASLVPAAQNNPTGYGIRSAGTQETRLESVVVTGFSAGRAGAPAAAQAVGPDSPHCRPVSRSSVAVASSGDARLHVAGSTISHLGALGPGGKASGIEANRVRDVIATRNTVSGLTGGYDETLTCGLDLSGVGSALVYGNRITGLHGADGAARDGLFYLDAGYNGGGAVGVRVTAPATATTSIVSNVVASVTGGAGTDMSAEAPIMSARDGGAATAVLLNGGPAWLWNNTLYRTVGGAGGNGASPGRRGQSAGLWVTNSANVWATNNALVEHEAGVLTAATTAARLARNDLWGNAADYAGVTPGAGDIHVAPGFVAAGADNFHLQAGSALVDAGLNDGPRLEDIDGEPRPQDGNGDGVAAADIGADEYWPGLHGLMTVGPNSAHPGDVLAYRLDLTMSTGPAVFPNVALTDTLPADLTYVPGSLRASSGLASETGGTIRWVGSVSIAGPVVLTFEARVGPEPGPRTILNVAEVRNGTDAPVRPSARAWIDPRTVRFSILRSLP